MSTHGTEEQPEAVVVRAAAGEHIPAAGVDHLFKLTAEHGDGRLGVERFVVPPGLVGAVPHRHAEHDECFLVLDGELTVAVGGGREVVLGPGDLADAPRGAVHGFRNAADRPVTALCLYTPAGYEGYFREVHAEAEAGRPVGPDTLRRLRARYGTETL